MFNSVGVGLLTCLGFFACLYVVWLFWWVVGHGLRLFGLALSVQGWGCVRLLFFGLLMGWWLLVCFAAMGVGCLVVCWFWANFGLLGWLGVALIGFCL